MSKYLYGFLEKMMIKWTPLRRAVCLGFLRLGMQEDKWEAWKTLWAKSCELQRPVHVLSCKFLRRSGLNFTNVLLAAFTLVGPKSAKWHCWLNCLFCTFGIYVHKSCMYNVDEIEPRSRSYKNFFSSFSNFHSLVWVFSYIYKKSFILKWPSLAAKKNGKILR